MSNFTTKFLLAIAILMFGGVFAANAQITGTTLKVSVPNSFILDDKTYPAGEYSIEQTPNTVDSSSLLVLRGEGKTAIFDTIATRSNVSAANTQLVFDKVGDQYFLSKIWIKGENTGNEIAKTGMEKRLIAKADTKEVYTVDLVVGL